MGDRGTPQWIKRAWLLHKEKAAGRRIRSARRQHMMRIEREHREKRARERGRARNV